MIGFRRFLLQSTFLDTCKRFGLKKTLMFVSPLAPEYGLLGSTTVKKGKVLTVVDPRGGPESVIHECVHAFFREKELEMGIPCCELTDYELEEITAFIVPMAILNKPLQICKNWVKEKIEAEMRFEHIPETDRIGRLTISLSNDCVFPEDHDFVMLMWGTDPLEVYNKLARKVGVEPIILSPQKK
ncbi:MAG: hypothetical protein QW175_00955 [Candidatus Bathyarchaeia archaeon]